MRGEAERRDGLPFHDVLQTPLPASGEIIQAARYVGQVALDVASAVVFFVGLLLMALWMAAFVSEVL